MLCKLSDNKLDCGTHSTDENLICVRNRRSLLLETKLVVCSYERFLARSVSTEIKKRRV